MIISPTICISSCTASHTQPAPITSLHTSRVSNKRSLNTIAHAEYFTLHRINTQYLSVQLPCPHHRILHLHRLKHCVLCLRPHYPAMSVFIRRHSETVAERLPVSRTTRTRILVENSRTRVAAVTGTILPRSSNAQANVRSFVRTSVSVYLVRIGVTKLKQRFAYY